VSSEEQQQGGLRGAEVRSFARGWNYAEWEDWEDVDVRGDLAAQEGEGNGEGNKCCETEECSSSASGYQEGGGR